VDRFQVLLDTTEKGGTRWPPNWSQPKLIMHIDPI
jgi:hypothetical protein